MVTLWEKISKANDIACAIFKAISDSDVDQEISKRLKGLFNNLEETRKQITPSLFVEKDDYAPQLMKELGPSNSHERSLNAVRYMARVNLATFTVALWTATHLSQALSGFFSHVIPKHYQYDTNLFETYLKISIWAAGVEARALITEEGDEVDITYLLRQYLEPTVYDFGVPESSQELESLVSMCRDRYRTIMELDYLEDWQISDAEARVIWSNACYEIMSRFNQLYPGPNSQVLRRSEADDDDITSQKSLDEPEEELSQEATQEVLLKGDFMEESDAQIEGSAEDSEGESNMKDKTGESEAGEAEEDELDEDEEEEEEEEEEDEEGVYLTPTESLATEGTPRLRSSSAKPSSPPGENLKRDVRDHDESDEDEFPKIKRPRVIPADPVSQTPALLQEAELVSSLESLEENPSAPNPQPDENVAPNNEISTASLVQSQQTQPPELHPFYADQALPHGLPRTINEGPASPISEDGDHDEQDDTTYREILQSTTAERSISVGAVPKRVRRDLPFSNAIERGPRALSPIGGAQAPSRTQRPGRKPYTPWSNEELEALEAGLEEFGSSWAKIKECYGRILSQRTNVQIKDKARTEYMARDKAGLDLGIYACMAPRFTSEQMSQRTARTASNRQQRQQEQSGEQ